MTRALTAAVCALLAGCSAQVAVTACKADPMVYAGGQAAGTIVALVDPATGLLAGAATTADRILVHPAIVAECARVQAVTGP